MSRLPSLVLVGALLTAAVAACGPRHQPAYMGPSVKLDHPFPKTSPDRLWRAVNAAVERNGWPVDSVSVADRRLVSGWMTAPPGSTDCGSYREVPRNVDAFEDEEYRLRLTVTPDEPGARVRIWTDHRATGWYGELVEDCVTTGQLQDAVRNDIADALGRGSRPSGAGGAR